MLLTRAMFALATLAPLVSGAVTPHVVVDPADGLADRPFAVRISGLRPDAAVRIEARLLDEQSPPQQWTAVGEFRADAAGRVDTARMPARGGTYRGVLPGGLACSGLPVAEIEVPEYLAQLSATPGRTSPLLGSRDEFVVTVTTTADGLPLGSTIVRRRFASPGVTVSELRDGRLVGLYFKPARTTGIPVVVVSGSGGGVWREHAAMLASRGHPALAVAMFNYPGLSPTLEELPIEPIGEATRWLAAQTGVRRVALLSASRGTEAIQLAAAHFPQHVAGLVLLVPSPLVHGGYGAGGGTGRAAWTIGGAAVPFVRLSQLASKEERARAGRTPPGHSDQAAFLAEWTRPEAYARWATPLERIDVPILALGGGKDQTWPSGVAAVRIKERMESLGKGRLVEMHVYGEAGHNISRPGIANRISVFAVHRVSKLWAPTGGEPEANCSAGYDSWQRTLEFLGRLHPSGD